MKLIRRVSVYDLIPVLVHQHNMYLNHIVQLSEEHSFSSFSEDKVDSSFSTRKVRASLNHRMP